MAAIVIDGVRREVAVTRTASGLAVAVDDRRYEVHNVARVGDTIAFLLDHESHVARVSSIADGLHLTIGGRTHVVQRDAADADRPATARGGDGRLEAPMPGSIVGINVSEGDHVRAGQPLVVLESMKMHNEIASPVDGVVKKVNCRVGQQVGFGHILVEIGAESP